MSNNNGYGQQPGDDQRFRWGQSVPSEQEAWDNVRDAIDQLPILNSSYFEAHRHQQYEAEQEPQFPQQVVPGDFPAYSQPGSPQHGSQLPREDVRQEDSSESGESDVSEDEPEDAPGDFSSLQPNVSQPSVGEQFSPAAFDTSQLEYPAGYGLPRDVYFGSTPYQYATSPDSPSGRELHDDPPDPEEAVVVGTSPAAQDLIPAPGPYERHEYIGTQQPEQYATIPQRHERHHKRTRESSSSSSAGNIRPRSKHHHRSEEHSQGSQGRSVAQGVPQFQQAPMQSATTGMSSLNIGALDHGGQLQTQRGGSAYGDPSPYRPPGGSIVPGMATVNTGEARGQVSAETQQISHAYANQQLPQLRHPGMLGSQSGATSSYASGAGRGHAPQTQGEGSAQGAGQLEQQPLRTLAPRVALPDPVGAFAAGSSHPLCGNWSELATLLQQNPMRGMSPSEVWKYIPGPDNQESVEWDGLIFPVDPPNTYYWTFSEEQQLRVIAASFLDWVEVQDSGQPLPGRRTIAACANKWRSLHDHIWTYDQDKDIMRLRSPDPDVRRAALDVLLNTWNRSKNEIVGRCMLFARLNTRDMLVENLGNTPFLGLRRRPQPGQRG